MVGIFPSLFIECGHWGSGRSDHTGLFHPQVLWQSTGRTYWVHWHMVEIIGAGEQPEEEAAQEKVSSLTENLKLTTGEVMCTVCTCAFSAYCSHVLWGALWGWSRFLSSMEWFKFLLGVFLKRKVTLPALYEGWQLVSQWYDLELHGTHVQITIGVKCHLIHWRYSRICT